MSNVPFFTDAHRDRIIGHMNEDHADAVLRYVVHFGKVEGATQAVLLDIDQIGMDIEYQRNGNKETIRIPFARPLESPEEAHLTLVQMAKEARLAGGPSAAAGSTDAALARAAGIAAEIVSNAKTVILGTVSVEGDPDASVAPVIVEKDNAFYVYVSELSSHTKNLLATGKVSVFFVEDESASKNLLARKRLTFACRAEEIARTEALFDAKLEEFKGKFGPIMDQLKNMLDFHLFRLVPAQGRLVIGFGQAYIVDAKDWTKLSHINEVDHVRKQ